MPWLIMLMICISIALLINIVILIRYTQKKKKAWPDTGYRPEAAVFVPCKNDFPSLKKCLRSVAEQDYPCFSVTFITGSEDDSASSVIRELIKDSKRKNLKHIIAGPAVTSSQKNHNLIKGIDDAGDAEVYAFADSDAFYPKDWLEKIIRPLAHGKVGASTSFISDMLPSNSLATQTRNLIDAFITVFLTGTGFMWGGSIAIKKKTFNSLKIKDLWKETVVDDLTLSKALMKSHLEVAYVSTRILHSHSNETFKNLVPWWIRQVHYEKLYFHRLWILTMIVYSLLIAPALLLPITLPVLLLEWPFFGAPATVILAISGIITISFMSAMPIAVLVLTKKPVTLRLVLSSPFAFLFASTLSLSTIFKRDMHWSGITYKLSYRGKVTRVRFKR